MAAYFLGSFFQLYVNRIFIFVHQGFLYIFGYRAMCIQIFMIRHIFRINLCRSQAIFFNRIFACITIGSYYLVHTAVWAGCHYIVLDQHRFAIFCANQGRSLVTILEIGHFFSCLFLNVSRSVDSFRIHRYQCFHTVATVDVKYLTSGAHTVSRIYVTAMQVIIIHSPVVPVFRPEIFQVVDI